MKSLFGCYVGVLMFRVVREAHRWYVVVASLRLLWLVTVGLWCDFGRLGFLHAQVGRVLLVEAAYL